MKELFQGRRFGFAPRPVLAFLAVGLAIGVTIVDLMAYFAWGSRETNGYVVVAYWLAIGTAIVAGLAAGTPPAEFVDVLDEGRGLAHPDPAAPAAAFFFYSASAAPRSPRVGAPAPVPQERSRLPSVAHCLLDRVQGLRQRFALPAWVGDRFAPPGA